MSEQNNNPDPQEKCPNLISNKDSVDPKKQEHACLTTGRERILIVEDDKDTQRFYHSVLAPSYDVYPAYNGEEGIEQIKKVRPHLLITDLAMPVLDGRALVLQVKKLDPKLPIIIVSGKRGMQTDPELHMATQVHSFLLKPINMSALISTVDQVIAMRKMFEQEERERKQLEALQAKQAEEQARQQAEIEARRKRASFIGRIEHMGLFPILQMLGYEKTNGCLILYKGEEKSVIFLREGKIVDCSYHEQNGREAFFQIAQWSEGKFEFCPDEDSPIITMEDDIELLLMELAQRIDEKSKE